jgi:serine/threonine protein kinase
MVRFSQVTKRSCYSLRTKSNRLPLRDPAYAISSQTLVGEERCPGCNPERHYPAKPGEILANQFQLMTNIGWGTGSTVWLAQDIKQYVFFSWCGLWLSRGSVASSFRWQTERFVALKILNTCSSNTALAAQDTEELIARRNPSHPGYGSIRTCLGSFEVTNKERKHLCQIYEPMRETMSMFQQRWQNRKIPLQLAKAYILLLLLGIDYLHAECKIIHTGKSFFRSHLQIYGST